MEPECILYVQWKVSYHFLFWPELDSRVLILAVLPKWRYVWGRQLEWGGYLVVHEQENSNTFIGRSDQGGDPKFSSFLPRQHS